MTRLKADEAYLIIASSESDANLYYATHFIAPDPFIFIQTRHRKILIASDLEVDRARKEAAVDIVLPSSRIAKSLRKKGVAVNMAEIAARVLKDLRIRHLVVPADFAFCYVNTLSQRGFRIRWKPNPFFEQRLFKRAEEIAAITSTLRKAEGALREAANVLKKSKIKGKYLIYRGKKLTSEYLKQLIDFSLFRQRCLAVHTIVSCGKASCDPHDQGSGPLLARQPIVIDIFPRSCTTKYFADITRTFVRGRAHPELKRMYQAIKRAQEFACSQIRHGADGSKIHAGIVRYFESRDFRTGEKDGRMQGFFHSTGHGVGLEIHEPPRISPAKEILRKGETVTVEPGLYYRSVGGVRLEDLVVVGKRNCRNLTRFPKVLEI